MDVGAETTAVKGEVRIRSRHLQRQAEGYVELGLFQEALNVLGRIGPEGQWDAHALYLRGEALRGLERYQEALVPLSIAAEKAPADIHVLLALGWCHKRTARLDLAIEDIQRALRIEPQQGLLHYNMACYLSLMGEKKRALVHLSQAIALDADFREMVHRETDFDPLRNDPEFVALVNFAA
jgi:tetratricopeptide (TPR) repeat protein